MKRFHRFLAVLARESQPASKGEHRQALPWTLRTRLVGLLSRFNLRRGLPAGIVVEVSTGCNRRCAYCPQSVSPAKQRIMDPAVWQCFIGRLREAGLNCFVNLTLFNELGLVPSSWAYVRDVARAGYWPRIYTNGDFPDAIKTWLAEGARQICITEHAPRKEGLRRAQPSGWRAALADVEQSPYVKIRRLAQIDNRAGWVHAPGWEAKTCCYFPDWLHVRVDGSVSLCCLDYRPGLSFGQIQTQSLVEIFQSPDYHSARALVKAGKPAMLLCDRCLARNKGTQ
jgi:2-deoxy-scyllo-inosamine dehydrogenase (SAM-dependent)